MPTENAPETAQDAWVSDYAYELIETPRAHLRMSLSQDERGLALTYQGREVLRCYLTPNGMLAGGFAAQALGVKIPALGESAAVRASTGVLYRAMGVCLLDFSEDASYAVLERLLEEAAMQRGAASLSE